MISKEILDSVLVEWRAALSFAEEHKRDVVLLDRDYRLGVPLTQVESLRVPVGIAEQMIKKLDANKETPWLLQRTLGTRWDGRMFVWNERGGGEFRTSSRHVTPWIGPTRSI